MFKVGDQVVLADNSDVIGDFTLGKFYTVETGGLVVDDAGGTWCAGRGAIHTFLPAPAPAQPATDPTRDAVLAWVKDHYHGEHTVTQGAYRDMVRRLFGLDITDVPATIEFTDDLF